MYDPTIGRWLSEDPTGLAVDANPYRYVGNAPTMFIDPTGLEAAEPPEGKPSNNYVGIGNWEFHNDEEAMAFFQQLLPEAERPPGWQERVKKGCVGLDLLRIGTPSGKLSFGPGDLMQNALLRPGAVLFSDRKAAEELLERLRKQNPGKQYVLVAVQIQLQAGGASKLSAAGPGPFKLPSGVIDPNKIGDFNFATQMECPNGAKYWEWMNHGLSYDDKNDLPGVRHRTNLPGGYGATIYVVVEKLPWNVKPNVAK